MKRACLAFALALLGCNGADRYFDHIGCDAGPEATLDLQAAITAWNAAGNGSVGLVYEPDASRADTVVHRGNIPQDPGACAFERDGQITINENEPAECSESDPATILAHELGHYMSGRHHSPLVETLMHASGNGKDVGHAITQDDVNFIFGEGDEI